MQSHAETVIVIGEYQCGFRRDRSTTDQIFNVRLILQKGREFNIPTHHLFIDFKAAYDTIKRTELCKVMKELGFESKLIRLVYATLNGSCSRIKVQNDFSNTFVTKEGLRQGDALSTLLLNVALEGAIRRARIGTSNTLASNLSQILSFADDLDLVGRTQIEVEEVFTSLVTEAATLGLKINIEKTKYMSSNRATNQQQNEFVNVGGYEFEKVDEFQCLGVSIRADGEMQGEIKRRIMIANRCFYGLQRQLRSNLLSKETKFNI